MEDQNKPEETHDGYKPKQPEGNQVSDNQSPEQSGSPADNTEPPLANPSVPATEDIINAPVVPAFQKSSLDLSGLKADVEKMRLEMRKFLIGQHEMVDLLLIGILSDGHILLEGVPGIAKTLTSKLLAKTIETDFSRIQFTPDLMPSDVIGTSIYNMKSGEFNFKKGPIFSNIVLIDEINRAPAKTQSALFEVMEERQITVDGMAHKMTYPFMIVATQNPVEQEGTYRLPEAQLDRFLFRVNMDYPSLSEEQEILMKFKGDQSLPQEEVKPVLNGLSLKKYRDLVSKVRVEDSIVKYISEITIETRTHGKLYLGASPRASLSMMHSSKAHAALRGRDFVTPDDVQFVAPHVLNHRIILNPEAEMEGILPEDIIAEIVKKVEVPR